MADRIDVEEFRRQGFVAERGFFPQSDTRALLAEIERASVHDDTKDPLTEGGLIFAHNLFQKSEWIRQFLSQQRIIDYLAPLTGGGLWVRWDQAVTKRPGAGVFRWHQDNGYNGLKTQHFQLWVAVTETRQSNGALWLAPGSHKRGLLPHTRVGKAQIEVQAPVGDMQCVDATMGDMILFSSLMLHRTGPNEADSSRVAYVAEYMPTTDYDYQLKKPFFVASTHGRSDPHFVDRAPGSASLHNQLLYWRPRARKLVTAAKKPARVLRDRLLGRV